VSGEVVFGCQISEHCTCHPKGRQHAAIVAAGRGKSGRVTVDLVWYGHPSGAVARLAELNEKHDPLAVIVDAGSQSGTLLRPLADAGVWVTSPPAREIATAHGEFLDLVGDGGLEHLDQPPLTAAVRAAQQRPLAGAAAWDRRGVQVDQSPLEAATLAVHAFLAWEVLSQPGTWVV
jgi:hypothetical protein